MYIKENKINSNSISKDGYIKFNVLNVSSLDLLSDTVEKSVAKGKLNNIHKNIIYSEINHHRINAYREINSILNWEKIYTSIADKYLVELLGPDMAIQSKLNLSIQMPKDNTSILSLHTDALSGQSVFELVLWLPLTDSFGTNSMYLFPPEISRKMLSELQLNEKFGMTNLFNQYSSKAIFLEVKKGEAIIFSPTLFHGNVVNTTNQTRVSINCRYKNIFSHEASSGERRLGSFYRIYSISDVTKMGLSYRDDLVSFL